MCTHLCGGRISKVSINIAGIPGKMLHNQLHLLTACNLIPDWWNRPLRWNKDGSEESQEG